MKQNIVILLLFALLTACARTGVIHEPARVTSAESAVDVRIHNLISGHNVTFTINDVAIYRFVEASYYDFVLDAGSYMFGYKTGTRTCDVEVQLNTGISYVFNLAPDCAIQMQ
jgi:hypothetical protein